jgi:RNA polymerase sigma-70 factor (ECF subfamily)
VRSAIASLDQPQAGVAALVEQARAGDRDAFARLIAPRIDGLYRTAWAVLRNEDQARDVTQETCIVAWRELGRLRDPDRFEAWLGRSLINRCRTAMRTTRRARLREIRVEDWSGDAVGSVSDPRAEAAFDAIADAESVRAAFRRLSVDHRTLIVLHHVQGRQVQDIAQLIGVREGTVKWRLSEARKALERALGEEMS